jgi:hypothetical protein
VPYLNGVDQRQTAGAGGSKQAAVWRNFWTMKNEKY